MSFNLDDLLNSALDELEVQENEKKSEPVIPPNTTTTTTTTTTSTVTSTTTTTSTSTTTNNTTTNSAPQGAGQFDFLLDLLKDKDINDLFTATQEEKDQLPNGFTDLLNNMKDMMAFNNTDGAPSTTNPPSEDFLNDLSEEEKKQFAASLEKMTQLFQQPNETQSNTNNNNNNNTATAPNQGINIKDFENNVSNLLKGFADQASSHQNDKAPSNEEDLLKQFAEMMSANGGGNLGDLGDMNETIDEFYDTSMKYIVEKYPAWIENNKHKYTNDQVEKFRAQCDTFVKLYNTDDKSISQDEMFDKVSMLGQLPEEFCEEYCKDIQKDLEGALEEQKNKE